jgi:hypothetical protein
LDPRSAAYRSEADMKIKANGISMNARLEGPSAAPVVTPSHSLATDLDMWRPQMPD